MNKLTNFILSIVSIFALTAMAPVVVLAQTDSTGSGNSSSSAGSTQASNPTTAAAKAAKLKERIALYKQKHAVNLEKAEEVKLKGVCKAAQKKVARLAARADKSGNLRSNAYKKITSSLGTLVPRIEAAGIDTTTLDKQQANLLDLVETYNTDLANYTTDLQDLSQLDCTADPAAFKSALEAARADRKKVIDDATAIRTYVTVVIKKSLHEAIVDLKAEAAKTKGEESKDTEDTTDSTTDTSGDQ